MKAILIGGPHDLTLHDYDPEVEVYRIQIEGFRVFSHYYRALPYVNSYRGAVAYLFEGCMLTYDHMQFHPNRDDYDELLLEAEWQPVADLIEELGLKIELVTHGYEIDEGYVTVTNGPTSIVILDMRDNW